MHVISLTDFLFIAVPPSEGRLRFDKRKAVFGFFVVYEP